MTEFSEREWLTTFQLPRNTDDEDIHEVGRPFCTTAPTVAHRLIATKEEGVNKLKKRLFKMILATMAAAAAILTLATQPSSAATTTNPGDICPSHGFQMCFFVDANFNGPGLLFPWGGYPYWANLKNVNGQNWNDRISSIVINGGDGYCFYQEANYGGYQPQYFGPGNHATVDSPFVKYNDSFSSFARIDHTDAGCKFKG
ncbi:peptidase inhibitor family I36 protein [Kribbella sp. NPDC051587]|uniref:peptidase inhibitor family I36 protein n=1 Tax=Kribbella sp. NPDC051587 TaxID=3364119 RepID=UPI0037907190